ncbi:YafY family protein [Brevibacillus brevis]|uniref:YafY family protein n=1 Tax=Brevibacillus brevis TaxID=1393 RepID=A0ABY9TEQ5_BREBE|nr:YafY family protein [Brevibacillus brevis]WNC17712.1 YafY family protein [Brevibacillus brevis]
MERMIAIIMMLLNRRRMSAQQLASHFEVSLRTIYRDLEAINAAGIPIVAFPGSSGGYEIMENFTIDRQYLSLEELVTVIAALKGVQSTAEDQQIALLLEKIKTLVPVKESESGTRTAYPIVYDFNPWGSTQESMRKVNLLREAVERRQRVSFLYTKPQGDAGERTIEPVTLVLKGYVWYVYGYCLWRQSYRFFRLSRIADLCALPESFEGHDNPVEKLTWLEEWDRADEVSLVMEFSASAHVRVRDMFSPEQIEPMQNGSLLVRASLPNDEWLHGMLLSFGDALAVIAPESIRDRIRETAKKMLSRYES